MLYWWIAPEKGITSGMPSPKQTAGENCAVQLAFKPVTSHFAVLLFVSELSPQVMGVMF